MAALWLDETEMLLDFIVSRESSTFIMKMIISKGTGIGIESRRKSSFKNVCGRARQPTETNGHKTVSE
jgi:hypothetical protein